MTLEPTGSREVLPDDYLEVLAELTHRIHGARIQAVRRVNTELLSLYWSIGRTILERQDTEGWGTKVIDRLSDDLRRELPEMTGLSRSNLKNMRRLAETWPEGAIGQQPVGQLPWGHVVLLLERLDDLQLRNWYATRAAENGWSRAVLLNQIKSNLHLRVGAAANNFAEALPDEDSEMLRELIKDPYNFEFLGITERVSERELESALIGKVQEFLLELGTGFAFCGRQVHLEIDRQDFYIDLLFYNVPLHRYVVIELKIDHFKPDYAGQLNFYVQAVDGELARPGDDPTIGILLCAERNETVVKYATRGLGSPMAVARYELSAEINNALPSDEQLSELLLGPWGPVLYRLAELPVGTVVRIDPGLAKNVARPDLEGATTIEVLGHGSGALAWSLVRRDDHRELRVIDEDIEPALLAIEATAPSTDR